MKQQWWKNGAETGVREGWEWLAETERENVNFIVEDDL